MLLHIYFYTTSHGTRDRARRPLRKREKTASRKTGGGGLPPHQRKAPPSPLQGERGRTGQEERSHPVPRATACPADRPVRATLAPAPGPAPSGPHRTRTGKKAEPGPEKNVAAHACVPAEGRLVRPRERGFRDKRLSENRARQKSRPIRSGSRKTAEAGFRLPEDGPPAPAADRGGPCRWGRTGRKCRAP